MSGKIGSREGIFPVNFVKIIKELPKQGRYLVCEWVSEREGEREKDMIYIKFWLHSGSTTTTAATAKKTTKLTDDLLPKAVALYDFTAGNDEEISFKVTFLCFRCSGRGDSYIIWWWQEYILLVMAIAILLLLLSHSPSRRVTLWTCWIVLVRPGSWGRIPELELSETFPLILLMLSHPCPSRAKGLGIMLYYYSQEKQGNNCGDCKVQDLFYWVTVYFYLNIVFCALF